MPITKVNLDHAFAEHLEANHEFQKWLLVQTRFARFAQTSKLLANELAAERDATVWWKHNWIKLTDGTESVTSILAIFEVTNSQHLALHIENKPSHEKLSMEQASDYRRRAIQMAGKTRYLNHDDFATILLAHKTFVLKHPEEAKQFDTVIDYEELAETIPLFAEATLQ